ncbi:hypothetical protein SDC9_114225 [bioreactor metagenome]|uniref:Uncharacterized protein n=1 Tax=bioreactor metagenome TaxID=1076179 RepID=A0A645BVY3_9ZZZZ
MVITPPRPAAKAKGINCLEAGIFAAEQIPKTTGSKQAAVPVLDNTEDNAAATTIIPNINPFSLVPETLTTPLPIFCARPV